MSNDNVFGGPYPLKQNEVIVATPYLGVLMDRLRASEVGVNDDATDTSPLLGLSLVQLTDPETAAAQLTEAATALLASKRAQTPYARPAWDADPLDKVLWALRTLFSVDYSGWTPTMGKNRTVGQIHGVGEVSHGGGGLPKPAVKPAAGARRPAGPGAGVRVGVLDSLLYAHPWLAGGWTARYSDRGRAKGPVFTDGHATFVSGLILNRAPSATVEVRHALENGVGDSWRVANQIVEFGRSGLDILNLSFVCYTTDGQAPLALSTAIDRLPPDVVVVAAAGNHGGLASDKEAVEKARAIVQEAAAKAASSADGVATDDEEAQQAALIELDQAVAAFLQRQARKPAWPAALEDVVAVGASTGSRRHALADFSPDAPWVDVVAPGDNVLSTFLESASSNGEDDAVPYGRWARWSGTSFAAALVSGEIAASTVPGRVSAQAALADILAALGDPRRFVGKAGMPAMDNRPEW